MAGELIKLGTWFPEYGDMWNAIRSGKKAPSQRRGIVIHHTVGARDDSESYARAVCRDHWNRIGASGQPWRRPGGYQEMIGQDGRVFEMTGLPYRGVHSGTFVANRDYIAIAFEGDYRTKMPSEEALYSAVVRVAMITMQLRWYGTGPLFKGHRDLYGRTTCPGGMLYGRLPGILFDGKPGDWEWPHLIRPGDRGKAISVLKGLLVMVGFPEATSDKYSKEWVQNVEDFQESSGLVVDGIVGPHTMEALMSALGDVLPQ